VKDDTVRGSAELSEMEPVGTVRQRGKDGNGGEVMVVVRGPLICDLIAI